MDGIGVKRPTHDPHATAYVDADGGAHRRPGRPRATPTRPATASTSAPEVGGRLRPAGPPVHRQPAGRGPGRGQRREALARRLRAVEEGQAGRAVVAVAVGRRAAGLAHRVRGHVARPAGRRLRPPRRRPGPGLPPPRERAGPGRGQRPPLRPPLGAQRLRRDRRREDVEEPRQLHQPARPDRVHRPAGLPAARAAQPLPLADRGQPRPTTDDASAALRTLDEFSRRAGELPPGEPDAAALDEFRRLMDDDLNTPGAFALLFTLVRQGNQALDATDDDTAGRPCWPRCAEIASAVGPRAGRGAGLPPRSPTTRPLALARQRDDARDAKDWDRADRLRAAAGGHGLRRRGHRPAPSSARPDATAPSGPAARVVPSTTVSVVDGTSCGADLTAGGRSRSLARVRRSSSKEREPLPKGFGTIWTTVAVDLIGFGIVLPILPQYAERFGASPPPSACWWRRSRWPSSSSPPSGDGCRTASAASRCCSSRCSAPPSAACSPAWPAAIALLFLGRIIDGASGASVSVAQASVADVAAPRDRARLMGLLGAAFGVGFVAGPAIGALGAAGRTPGPRSTSPRPSRA